MMLGIDHRFSKPTSERTTKKKLSALKEMDPEAYDFRRNDNQMVYSRLCQHKDQPIMYSMEEYNKMTANEKKKLFEYWNFTKNEKAYFNCPDMRKPYISFIVNKHPRDYCLICCKITPSDPLIVKNKNIKKTQIFNACKEEHYYTGNKIVRQKSKYIMTYGKDIDPGRISHLPDETIAPLFKDTLYDYSLNNEDPNINFELCNTKSYYLYGIQQNIGVISNVGGLLAIAHAMDIPYVDLIQMCLVHLKKFGFDILLQGGLTDYFENVNDLITTIKRLFIDTNVKIETHYFDKWNELFMDMVKLYFQTVILLFEDVGHDNVDFIIPPNIKRSEEMIPRDPSRLDRGSSVKGGSTTKDETRSNLEGSGFKFIILLKKNLNYYPIYIIEPEKFFKNDSIERRIFYYNDGAITKIVNMIEYSLDKEEKVHRSIDLNIIQDFVKKNNKYLFHKQFINTHNLIYGVLLEYHNPSRIDRGSTKSKGLLIYVPVDFSYYSMIDVPLDYVFIRANYTLSPNALYQFIIDYNKYILHVSMKRNLYTLEFMELSDKQKKKVKPEERIIPFYPFIKPEKFVAISAGEDVRDIGFISNGMTYYWTGQTTISKFSHINKTSEEKTRITLNYDPDYVNKAISSQNSALTRSKPGDKRLEKLGRSLYEHNIYHIVVMEFMKTFTQQKNIKIRKAIVDIIKKTNFKSSLTNFIKEFNEILSNYPNDSSYIRTQINEFYNVHFDKSILIEQINGSYYDFDRIDLGEDPRDQLKKLASKFVKIGEPKVGTFPNIMVPCEDSDASYCVNNKLVIPAKKLNEIIDIFADIIKNKYFETYIGYVAFMNNTRDYFDFEKREGEDIDIQPYVL